MLKSQYSDYGELIGSVLEYGADTPSRMGPTKELLGVQFRTVPGYIQGRAGLRPGLGYMELAQLLAGIYDLDALKWIAPKADHSLFTPQMAYGPRLKNQIVPLLETMQNIPDSRQLVLFVGQPQDGPTSDLPCTVTIQFLVRPGIASLVIHCLVSMRSWDLVKGMPYDLMMFGGLQLAVAMVMGLTPGELVVTAGSAHVYNEDVAKGRMPQHDQSFRFSLVGDPGYMHKMRGFYAIRATAADTVRYPLLWTDGVPEMVLQEEWDPYAEVNSKTESMQW